MKALDYDEKYKRYTKAEVNHFKKSFDIVKTVLNENLDTNKNEQIVESYYLIEELENIKDIILKNN